MNLYLLTQDEEFGYETFDSVVVAVPHRGVSQKDYPSGDDAWAH